MARIGTSAKRVAIVITVLSAVAVGVMFWAGGTIIDRSDCTFRPVETEQLLITLVAFTDRALRRSGKWPPTEQLAYAQWLAQWCGDELRGHRAGVDIQKGEILDAWDRPIVLVTLRTYLVSVGSRGPNGLWEEGKADDIVVMLPWGEAVQRGVTTSESADDPGTQPEPE